MIVARFQKDWLFLIDSSVTHIVELQPDTGLRVSAFAILLRIGTPNGQRG
jgi:hypothetical protein